VTVPAPGERLSTEVYRDPTVRGIGWFGVNGVAPVETGSWLLATPRLQAQEVGLFEHITRSSRSCDSPIPGGSSLMAQCWGLEV